MMIFHLIVMLPMFFGSIYLLAGMKDIVRENSTTESLNNDDRIRIRINDLVYITENISDMICRGVKTPIKIVGLEEAPISDISLKNINITEAKDKCIFEDCNNILMDKVIVNGEEVKLDL